MARPSEPRVATPPERVTLAPGGDAVVNGHPDDHLGMVLAPEIEHLARSERTTILWHTRAPGGHRSVPPEAADFGPYELIEEIGRGGMGVVYKARQKGLDRMVAIKMILASHLASPEQVERFYAEARAAAQIQDPRVVSIHDVGQLRGQHYFAMEFVPGPSLADVVAQGPVPFEEAARLMLVVARTVGRLHQQGIVHRDLKPSNILLDDQGNPSVTDFGLAKMLSGDRPATHTGAIVGTPSYMAPEQAAGRSGVVGPLSDVYSLGAILYELLTGRPPFQEENPLDTLVQALESEPARPVALRADVPRALELICLRCLEKAPEARYASADALADDLERYLRGETVEARRLTVAQRLNRWTRREPALVSRLGAFGLVAAVLQVDAWRFQQFDPVLIRRTLGVLWLGAAASLLFQTLLKRPRWSTLARYAWSTADMILFSSVIFFARAVNLPVIAGFLLLISAAGLWFRERLVWYTAALGGMAYVALILFQRSINEPTPGPADATFLLLGMFLAAFVTSYQVKRVRALSAFYENRPLP
jgi:serine/threonine-protein kinase